MLRTEWSTLLEGVVCVTRAQANRPLAPRAARLQNIASDMLTTTWWTFTARFTRIPPHCAAGVRSMINDAPTACLRHKSDIVGSPVIKLKLKCKVAQCSKVSRRGLRGKQPTYCRDPGPFKDGLVRTVGTGDHKIRNERPSFCPVRDRPFRVKTVL